jgi:hypothetical protein
MSWTGSSSGSSSMPGHTPVILKGPGAAPAVLPMLSCVLLAVAALAATHAAAAAAGSSAGSSADEKYYFWNEITGDMQWEGAGQTPCDCSCCVWTCTPCGVQGLVP